jgi:nitric oxide synthase oxygenase domain/subunit/sulfite reductase alpha subunit-like flavoprotein
MSNISSSSIPNSPQALLENLERMKKRNQDKLAAVVRSFNESNNDNSTAKNSTTTVITEDDDSVSDSSASLLNPYDGTSSSTMPAWFSSYLLLQEQQRQKLSQKLQGQEEEIERLQQIAAATTATTNIATSCSSSSSSTANTTTPHIPTAPAKGELITKSAINAKGQYELLVPERETAPSSSPLKLNSLEPLELAPETQNSEDAHTTNHRYKVGSTPHECQGDLMKRKRGLEALRNSHSTSANAKIQDAINFLNQFAQATGKLQRNTELEQRLEQLKGDIETTGTYTHTRDELEFGCRLAWRNAGRCNSRDHHTLLMLRDSRHILSAKDCFEDLVRHLKYAFNDGAIRPVISIFRPKQDGQSAPIRIWNRQLLGYAAYRRMDGSLMGDPANLQFTALCQEFGWTLPKLKTDFDVLPLLISDASTGHTTPQVFEIPSEAIHEVRLKHPDFDLFEMLNLRWYALPCISNMGVDIGGIHYQTAPFNRLYQVTEIAQNLLDRQRYNLAQAVAIACDIPQTKRSPLWKDEAQLELHKAILSSFFEHSVSSVDHRTASQPFSDSYAAELKERGTCPADKAWLVPPAGGSTTSIYHQDNMINYFEKPQYRLLVDLWEDLGIWLPEPITVDGTKTIATSYSFDRETCLYDKVYIYYGSESGISLRMATLLALEFGSDATGPIILDDLPDLLIERFEQQQQQRILVVVVTATRGTGDPPATAKNFTSRMATVPDCSVDSIDYAVLALGNSAYRQSFAAFGYKVDMLLNAAGCSSVMKMRVLDEQNGKEAAFESFKTQLLQVYIGQGQRLEPAAFADYSPEFATISFDGSAPMLKFEPDAGLSHPVGFLHLNSSWESHAHKLGRSLDLFTFRVDPECGILMDSLAPGDLIALYPSNMDDVVEYVFRNVNVESRDSAKELLKDGIDLSRPLRSSDISELGKLLSEERSKQLVDLIATHCTQAKNPSIESLVQMLPPGSVSMEWILHHGPFMNPRFYSIAAIDYRENTVTIAQSVYSFETTKKAGVASRWLRSLARGDKTKVLFVPTEFHPPEDPKSPLLLLAADSGIIPFHSFWQPRCQNPLFLFYACRNPSEVPFASQIAQLELQGRMQPYIAYTHVKEGRMQIDELIWRTKDSILNLLHNKRTTIYLCGSPELETTIRNALVVVLAEGNEYYPGLGTQRALERLAIMSQTNRFLREIYGTPSFTEDPMSVMWQEAVSKVVRCISGLQRLDVPQGHNEDTFDSDSNFMSSSKTKGGKRYNPKILSTV